MASAQLFIYCHPTATPHNTQYNMNFDEQDKIQNQLQSWHQKKNIKCPSCKSFLFHFDQTPFFSSVRIITETASAARLLLANEDLLSHLMDQSGVRLTSMTAQAVAPTGWLGQANGQSTSQNSGGQSGRDGAGGRKDRARGAEAARAEPAATLKLGDSSQLSINLMA